MIKDIIATYYFFLAYPKCIYILSNIFIIYIYFQNGQTAILAG